MTVVPFRSPMAFMARRINARYNYKSRATEIVKKDGVLQVTFVKRRHLARKFILFLHANYMPPQRWHEHWQLKIASQLDWRGS